MEQTKENYVQYLALSFGGQQKYTGKQLKTVHTPYHIHDKLFSYCILQIQQAFKDNGTDVSSANEIGRLLECLRSEIPKKNNTLFDRLGGNAVFQNSMNMLYNQKIPENEKIKDFFKSVNRQQLAQKMCDFYTMITGGPYQYNGKNVKDAHQKFYITYLQFEVYKNLLKECLEAECKNKQAILEFINLLETIKIEVMGGKSPSLFEKMGGEEQLNIFTETFFTRVMAEKKIKHYFINVDLKKLKIHFKEFLGMGMGGHGKKYNGENVRDFHQKMDFSNKDFDNFKELIVLTVQDLNYKPEIQSDIINFFESMRLMIVSE
ncbi:protozoan cyanobacterial globin family protein, putative [Ichthyophthirius multifiliis]|uniref:Protozoan cyanobacterial globin family protein, putative n=1 Tax=Ichthyophthirius multifiliis TaxID=5932 RepID=G0R1U5_ICHMU|nr:protozoan cyanobacterial globin family protein, putative [Ichthyophthirius multifiliis]EGR28554.1 protozoan cyanobacterial globin family protein, putative [Ichthyophthirius multifiliis]|eukprot:XP_004029790.1 protozoan cyanobacterial globin family protein, putative [Ichthyophthirius multifiliis]